MMGLGYLAQDILGTSTCVSGLACTATGPASMAVLVGLGRIYSQQQVDATAYSDIGTDTTDIISKQGILLAPVTLSCPAPLTTGFSINYLVQVAYQDSDTANAVLPYYNAANPTTPLNGPGGLGTSQPTQRDGIVSVLVKAGTATTTGGQTTPAPDAGYIGIWVVTVNYGATVINAGSIFQYPGAPFISATLFSALTQSVADARYLQFYARTAAEITAGITPISTIYPELDVRRYGALAANSGSSNAAAIQSAVSVLAQHVDGELLIPAGLTLNTAQVTFASMSQFNIRCDGVLVSSASAPGAAFTNQTASQGTYTPLKFTSCTTFKVYGKGYINPGYVDALNITSCSDWDWYLDVRGTGLNSVMRAILIQESFKFRVHASTFDSLTAQNMQNALTTTAVVNAGATSATATTWTGGAGAFNVFFTEVAGGAQEFRSVTFGAGTSNVGMTWTGGLTNNCTATFYSEIYYNWLDTIAIFSCYNFKIDHNMVRKSGANGIYLLSVGAGGAFGYCYDFDVTDNTCEYNAESGIQCTYAGGTQANANYRINNNTLRYNQADGLDVANTGPFTLVLAQFNGNTHDNNGWINCNPANPGGVDGSGVGTFSNIGAFECIGSTVTNCNNAIIYVNNCTNWRITNVNGGKTNTGSSQGGVYISNSPSGTLRDCDIGVATTVPSLTMQASASVTIDACQFTGGTVSLASGAYPGSKMSKCAVTTPSAINWVMDSIDNVYTITGGSAQGLVASSPGLKSVRDIINSAGSAININGQNYCEVDGGTMSVSTAASGVLVTAANGVRVTNTKSTSTSSPAFQFTGACDRPVLAMCQANSTSGNAYSFGSSCTNTTLLSIAVIGGTATDASTSHLLNLP